MSAHLEFLSPGILLGNRSNISGISPVSIYPWRRDENSQVEAKIKVQREAKIHEKHLAYIRDISRDDFDLDECESQEDEQMPFQSCARPSSGWGDMCCECNF